MELSNQEVYTNDHEQTNEAQAEAQSIDQTIAHWERILQDEGLGQIEADGLYLDEETLYLGIAGTTCEGIDLPGEADVELFDGEADEEIPTPVGPSMPRLLSEDFEVLRKLHATGEAMTLDEADASPETIVRLGATGFAHGRIPDEGDVIVLASAGATDRDVWRAVNRARCDVMEAEFLSAILECERIAEVVLDRTRKLGCACEERELVNSLLATHPREAIENTLAELGGRGLVRRAKSRATGISLVVDPEAGGETLVAKVKTLRSLKDKAAANRKVRGKAFATEASGSRPDDDAPADPSARERAFAEFIRAYKGGSQAVAQSKAEAGRIEANRARMRAEYIERRTSGRALVVTEAKVLDERYDRRRNRQVRKRNFWGRISAKALVKALAKAPTKANKANGEEKIALDTARAILRNLGIEPDSMEAGDRKQALLTVLAHEPFAIATSGKLGAMVRGFKAAARTKPDTPVGDEEVTAPRSAIAA